ncbi:HAMP domain-containing protein [Vibrio aquaticus]|uniref:histidine kinase n=1 Tax=Vibrio aquaticus TaxID=2496559 RepID=A0A3S0MQV3_9VIBR|nr:ATP-binding protein [Vibrio aquaticus]RTZ17894.1 HAMP domain-containing protein [Vibrio aquaticus]
MRRIYVESFVGLFVLFVLSMYAYKVIVFEMNPNYEYMLARHEGAALRELITEISADQGQEKALSMLNRYAKHTAHTLAIVDYVNLPQQVKAYFDAPHEEHPHTYFDHEHHLWMQTADHSLYYHLHDDDSTELRQAIYRDDNLVWGFISAGFFIYSGGLIWFLNRRVRKLERATLKFAAGDLTARAPERSKDQVGTLNKSFNYMAKKIADLITSNRSLTNAVAHDLRTPIFRIQWQAEILQDETLTKEQHSKIVSIIEDTEEMEAMINDLLHFAKLEQPETQVQSEAFNLNQVLSTVSSTRNEGLDITVNTLKDGYVIIADKALVQRSVDNLLSNANRYAKSSIQVSTHCSKENISIIVEDDGEGIDPEHWPQIFDAFYSADPARNKATSGSGLGLAIVKMIAEKHQGSVQVGSSSLGGAKFTLTFPRVS